MITAVITGKWGEAKRQIEEVKARVGAFEFRLDSFESLDHERILQLKELAAKPVIFTLRKKSHGGAFKGSEEERLRILRGLLELSPDYVDLECDTDPQFAKEVGKKTQLICSYHNFEKTPDNFGDIEQLMNAFPPSIWKVATYANSSLDAMQLFAWGLKRKNRVVIAMGERGAMSRILSPIIGNTFHLVAPDEKSANAPGQLSLDTLESGYHFSKLSPSTQVYALLGDPVSKSISHLSHNAVFSAHNIDAVYVKIHIALEELVTFLALLKEVTFFEGFSITMPLKEEAFSLVAHLDKEAQVIGSINTLVKRRGEWWGFNTDKDGALNALDLPPQGAKVLILGAGGTAKAVAYEAKKRGADVTIANRTFDRAERLAEELGYRAIALDPFPDLSSYTHLVNTTSVGMLDETSPVPEGALLSTLTVMDAIFSRKETKLLRDAKEVGCRCVYGIEMFTGQAVEQFRLWFGDAINAKRAWDEILKVYSPSP